MEARLVGQTLFELYVRWVLGVSVTMRLIKGSVCMWVQ